MHLLKSAINKMHSKQKVSNVTTTKGNSKAYTRLMY